MQSVRRLPGKDDMAGQFECPVCYSGTVRSGKQPASETAPVPPANG